MLSNSFSVESLDHVLCVNSVQLDCLLLTVKYLYVIDVSSDDEIPIVISVSHLLEHEGTWIVCGFMQIVEQYSSCLDAYVLQDCREYIAISPSEILSYGPIPHVNIFQLCL